jgi:rhomboid protease GluP
MKLVYKLKDNYLSHSHYKNALLWSLIPITLIVVISNMHWLHVEWTQLLYAKKSLVDSGEWWRVFTTSFLHADIGHLLSNLLMYFILTYFLYSYFGSFLSIFFPIILGGVINLLTLNYYTTDTTLVGASGIVYYLWGFWLVLFYFLQKKYTRIGRSLRVGAIFLVLLVPTKFEPQTSYFAHYAGFAIGITFGLSYYFIRKRYFSSFNIFEVKVEDTLPVDFDYGEPEEEYKEYH